MIDRPHSNWICEWWRTPIKVRPVRRHIIVFENSCSRVVLRTEETLNYLKSIFTCFHFPLKNFWGHKLENKFCTRLFLCESIFFIYHLQNLGETDMCRSSTDQKLVYDFTRLKHRERLEKPNTIQIWYRWCEWMNEWISQTSVVRGWKHQKIITN